jgi:hypothetical protein
VATALLAAGVLLGSTGCAFFSPVATQIPYNASDGVSTTVGDIKVRNAMAITADGETVNLVMFVHNTGEKSQKVKFQYNFDTAAPSATDNAKVVTIDAGETISFGNGGDAPEAILTDANTDLGSLMPVFVQYGDETGKTMLVPVLDGTLPGYADLVPTAVATAPAVPTPAVTATPTPTATTAP